MNILVKGGFCLLFPFLFIGPIQAQELQLHIERNEESPSFGQITIEGIGEELLQNLRGASLSFREWISIFSVQVEGFTQPVSGTYIVEEELLVFTPRFLPDPAISYLVQFHVEGLTAYGTSHFPQARYQWEVQFTSFASLPTVLAFYPKADTLPANVLRLYLDFSAPMGLENPYNFIQVLDGEGVKLEDPFVEIPEGLWSPDRKRLTLFLHPGRIKRGVGPHVSKGEVFEVGRSYTLHVSLGENEMLAPFQKTFVISPPIRSAIDVHKWNIIPPKLHSQEALQLLPDRMLDAALSQRLLSIRDAVDHIVPGTFSYSADSKYVQFLPDTPWSATSYRLEIDHRLEDVCGNTPTRAFDVEGSISISPTSDSLLFLPFTPLP